LIFVGQVVGLSCALGLAIDLITANVAVEYFTVHHPKVIDSNSPWVMALYWGIAASWWCGLLIAPLLWWVNVKRPVPLGRNRVLGMVAKSMIVIWAVMMSILIGVYLLGGLVPMERRSFSFESDRRLMAVAVAHMTEYALAALVAIVLAIRIRRVKA
jgi:hypothetical protein